MCLNACIDRQLIVYTKDPNQTVRMTKIISIASSYHVYYVTRFTMREDLRPVDIKFWLNAKFSICKGLATSKLLKLLTLSSS